MQYKSILVAVDFSSSADDVIQRASAIREKSARLIITHIVDHLPPLGFGEEPLIAPDWMIPEQTLLDEAKKSLTKLCEKHQLSNVEQRISLGTAHYEITQIAKDEGCDLIVLGSHGRHGVRLLLGSTANGVLHHASCDVLAVRIRD
jgi:universal stress protein A